MALNPDVKDGNNKTLLSCAAEYWYEVVVKLLLARDGVDPGSKEIYD